MKVLDRIELIEQIGRELQSRMTFSDIDTYLTAFGIDCRGITPSTNSKYVYVKEVLAEVTEALVLEIADELEILHAFSLTVKREATCWKPGHFRLFLSHLSSFKRTTANLQAALRRYGVSAFVAHEDIEPSKEWQLEIESALHTMDALAAILIPGVRESSWCDQEIGIALGRDVLVIPVRREIDPYGFIGKYQGIQAVGKSVGQVAEELWKTLLRSNKTAGKAIASLVTQLSQSTEVPEAQDKLAVLASVPNIPQELLESACQAIKENSLLVESSEFIDSFNSFLRERGMTPIASGSRTTVDEWDDDIPF